MDDVDDFDDDDNNITIVCSDRKKKNRNVQMDSLYLYKNALRLYRELRNDGVVNHRTLSLDFESEVVKELKFFLYKGHLRELTIVNYESMLILAVKYEIPHLAKEVERMMFWGLDKDLDMIEVLKLSIAYVLKKVETKALYLIMR